MTSTRRRECRSHRERHSPLPAPPPGPPGVGRAGSSSGWPAASRRTRPATLLRRFTGVRRADVDASCRPPPRWSSSARPPGRRCRASRSPPTCGATSTRCRTCGSASPPTSSWSRRPPPTCWPGPRTAWPTTCSPTPCSPPAARSSSPRRCTPRCGSTPPPQANVATLRARGALVIEPAEGRLTGADTGKGRLPEPAEIFDACLDVLARGVGRRPTWPAGTSWSPPAAPASTSTRCASSATAPRACRATRWPGPPSPAAPRSRWSARTSRCPTRPGSRSCASRPPSELRAEVVAAAGSADAVVMAAAPADFRPTAVSGPRSRRPPTARRRAIELDPEPRHPARDQHRPGAARARWWWASPPRPATTSGSVLDLARAKLARKGCDLLVVNDVSGGAVFGSPRQRGRDPRRRRRRRSRCRAARRRRSPTSSGTKWPPGCND